MLVASLIGLTLIASTLGGSPWDPSFTQKAQQIVDGLTTEQILTLVHGVGGSYVGNVPAIESAGIPSQNEEDGPQGVADGINDVTCWPSALTVCMSWDPNAMYAFGKGMGEEQYGKGTNVMLGPGVNIARVPWGGRNFEYLGEDPFLAGSMVFQEVLGIQSQNISGCVKHFVDNNQEYNRGSVSENVPRRAQWELYYPAFSAAVDAGVGSAMCSYNRINNTYACENPVTIGDLKDRLGFRGYLMSDWGATHSTNGSAWAGLDQEEPDNQFFGEALANAVGNGTVPVARIKDMAVRMVTPMLALGLWDNQSPARNLSVSVLSDAHNQLARELAEASITLLKNDNALLPVDASTLKSIAVIGDSTTVHGYGSGGVNTPYIITPFQGVQNVVNPGAVRPVNCTVYENTDFYQPGNPSTQAASAQDCCAKCTADPSCFAWTYQTTGTCWLKPNTDGQRASDGLTSGTCAPWPAGAVNVTQLDGTDLAAAVALAQASDLVIVSVATTSSEGSDRTNLSLPAWHDDLVAGIAAVAAGKLVVVARCPGPCFMPWINSVHSVLYQLMPGQEAGNALANAIFGKVNPSGRLPVSFPATMDDTWLGNPVNPLQYPGTDRGLGWLEADYSEELLVGYRWYDAQSIAPLFPFGHGLSYTQFTYSNFEQTSTGPITAGGQIIFSVDVQNTGKYDGAEVAQLYVSFPASAGEPPKTLKGFLKPNLSVGQNVRLNFIVSAKDLSIFDVTVDDWVLVPGNYTAHVASTSRDIRASVPFTAA